MSDFLIGLAMLISGIVAIIYIIKSPSKETFHSNLKIWIGGIFLIIIGLMLLLGLGEFK